MVFFVDKLNIRFMHWMSQCFFGEYYMRLEDRENLAKAYVSAWNAVKGRKIIIGIEANGWFTRSWPDWHAGADKKRASDLIRGLVVLTEQLNKRREHEKG